MSVDLDSSANQLPLFSLEVAYSQPGTAASASQSARNLFLVYCSAQEAAADGVQQLRSAPGKLVQRDVEAQLLKRVSLF